MYMHDSLFCNKQYVIRSKNANEYLNMSSNKWMSSLKNIIHITILPYDFKFHQNILFNFFLKMMWQYWWITTFEAAILKYMYFIRNNE